MGLHPKPRQRANPLDSWIVPDALRPFLFFLFKLLFSVLDELRSSHQAIITIVPIAMKRVTSGGETIPVRMRMDSENM
ncbi:MAG: hypothetical protein ACI9S8_001341 [Chlamydiales bacterium]|jgi:hypothetical protein